MGQSLAVSPGQESIASAKQAARAAAHTRQAGREAFLPHPGEGSALVAALLGLPEIAAAHVVALYAAMLREVPTSAVRSALRERGQVVLLPRYRPGSPLTWAVDAGELVAGPAGTLEPPPEAAAARLADADVVVVPGLAFTPDGRRLGRGAGAYDRALAERADGALLVGLAFDDDVLAELPVEDHDVGVDVVITPTRVLRAGTGT